MLWIEKDWVAIAWNDIVCPDNPDHLIAGTRTEGIEKKRGGLNYAVKYACDGDLQKIVPFWFRFVGRFYGYTRGIKPKILHSIQVNGYEDCRYLLRYWKNNHIINHNVIISELWGVSHYLPVPQL